MRIKKNTLSMLKIKNKHEKWTIQYVLIMAQGIKTKITSPVTPLSKFLGLRF
jgi:hypothetical protein